MRLCFKMPPAFGTPSHWKPDLPHLCCPFINRQRPSSSVKLYLMDWLPGLGFWMDCCDLLVWPCFWCWFCLLFLVGYLFLQTPFSISFLSVAVRDWTGNFLYAGIAASLWTELLLSRSPLLMPSALGGIRLWIPGNKFNYNWCLHTGVCIRLE